MNKQNLIVYRFNIFYQLLKELENDLGFRIIEISNEKSLANEVNNFKSYLIITKKKILGFDNQLILNQLPVKFFKLIERLNIEFLKQQFIEQSQITINEYTIDINAREIFSNNNKLKLTEKEINTIIYLSKVNEPVSVDELQTKVWNYQSNMETHTVETHIYRLRKKISKNFSDDDFITSTSNGYQIKQVK